MKSDTVVSLEDLKGTKTLKEYNEWRDNLACRIMLNWVKAGVINSCQLGLKEPLLQLELNELILLFLESLLLMRKYGLPLAYRLDGRWLRI